MNFLLLVLCRHFDVGGGNWDHGSLASSVLDRDGRDGLLLLGGDGGHHDVLVDLEAFGGLFGNWLLLLAREELSGAAFFVRNFRLGERLDLTVGLLGLLGLDDGGGELCWLLGGVLLGRSLRDLAEDVLVILWRERARRQFKFGHLQRRQLTVAALASGECDHVLRAQGELEDAALLEHLRVDVVRLRLVDVLQGAEDVVLAEAPGVDLVPTLDAGVGVLAGGGDVRDLLLEVR